MGGDTHRTTLEETSSDIDCPYCSENYSVNLGSSCCGGELYCDDLPENTQYSIEESED